MSFFANYLKTRQIKNITKKELAFLHSATVGDGCITKIKQSPKIVQTRWSFYCGEEQLDLLYNIKKIVEKFPSVKPLAVSQRGKPKSNLYTIATTQVMDFFRLLRKLRHFHKKFYLPRNKGRKSRNKNGLQFRSVDDGWKCVS